jgi:hypothetical protein
LTKTIEKTVTKKTKNTKKNNISKKTSTNSKVKKIVEK